VKNFSTGFICTCLLVVAGNLPGRAQEKKPDPQSVEQTVPATDPAQQPPAADNQTPAAQQTPPAQQPAAADDQTPAAQQTPPAQQAPPDQQAPPATGQTPTPPPAADQPTQQQHGRVPELPPPPVKIPDVRRPGESGFWVGIDSWFPKAQPIFNKGNGAGSNYTDSSLITLQGSPKYAAGIEVGAAVGLHNTLKFNYTDFRASGDFTTPVDVIAFAQTYTAGTYVSTAYHVQSFNLSYEYLTWPYPVGSRKFRLKTLWQVQYTQINSAFDAPLDYYDSNGNLILDSAGNPINLSASKYEHILSPMLGLAPSYYPSRHFRIEAEATGFGLPHHYYIWNGDIALSYRVLNHFEIRAGERAFGFKTSTNADYFVRGRWAAVFFGIRWYSNSE
jgi:hypothetical protein